jgi:hypothetical protein
LGAELPPRRVMDIAFLKTKNYKNDEDNYVSKGKIVYNKYKTKKTHGEQVIKLPRKVNLLVSKLIKDNSQKSDYLFLNTNDEPYTQQSLSKHIKNLFNGNSQDMLRSIYLSEYFKDLPKLQEMEKQALDMGHSISSQLNYYVKNDA